MLYLSRRPAVLLANRARQENAARSISSARCQANIHKLAHPPMLTSAACVSLLGVPGVDEKIIPINGLAIVFQ
ncbi:MAG: hypothetical protein VB137_07050 [Burkholderia sp.]